jgi:hypothetical protein
LLVVFRRMRRQSPYVEPTGPQHPLVYGNPA